MKNNELSHYGVLGMKWGIRRYQDYDGTRIKRPVYSDDEIRKRDLLKKKSSEMTTKELKELNDRLNAERQYNNLTASDAVKVGASVVATMGVIAISDIVRKGNVGKDTVVKMLAGGTIAGISAKVGSIDKTYVGDKGTFLDEEKKKNG